MINHNQHLLRAVWLCALFVNLPHIPGRRRPFKVQPPERARNTPDSCHPEKGKKGCRLWLDSCQPVHLKRALERGAWKATTLHKNWCLCTQVPATPKRWVWHCLSPARRSSRDTPSKPHAMFCGASQSVGNGTLASETTTKSGSLNILRPQPRLLFLYLASELMLSNCDAGEDLRVPWTARRSKQSILKEISPEYSLEGLMLKLKLQYFGHLMGRADSLEKTLMVGKIEAGGEGDDRGWDGWMASPTGWIWVWASSGRWWKTGEPGMLQSMGSQRLRHDLATEQQNQVSLPSEIGPPASLRLTSSPVLLAPRGFLDFHLTPYPDRPPYGKGGSSNGASNTSYFVVCTMGCMHPSRHLTPF